MPSPLIEYKLSKLQHAALIVVKTRPGITTTELHLVLIAVDLSTPRFFDCWRVVHAVFKLTKAGWLRVENESECWPDGIPSMSTPPMRLLLCREIPALAGEGERTTSRA